MMYTPRRIAALVFVFCAAILLWPIQRAGGPYAAAPISLTLVVVSLLAFLYMAGSLAWDIWLLKGGADLAVSNTASFILWKLGRRESAFIWLNGLSTFAVGLWAVRPIFWCYLIFQAHLFFSITGLPEEKV